MKFDRLVVLDAHTLYPAGDRRWDVFADYAASCTFYERTRPEELAERIAGADAVLTNKVALDAGVFADNPSLRYVGVLATGYNIVDTAAAAGAGVTVTNVPAYSTASVAQTAIALLLAAAQHVEVYAHENAMGRWAESLDFSYRLGEWHELAGKTIGIVGFGNTGSATAAIAAALGMKVAVYTSKAQEALPQGYRKVSLDEIFADSDVVSLHCPLTPDTRNMVNAERLASMKPSAILINTARGPLVDEYALAVALSTGIIAAAGLDVMAQEPPVPENPLIDCHNCLITPHIAWASAEARARLMDTTIGNVRAFLDGKPRNVVN